MRTLTLLNIDYINLLSKLLKQKYKFELTLTFPIELQSNSLMVILSFNI